MLAPVTGLSQEQLLPFLVDSKERKPENQVVITYTWYNTHRVVGHLTQVASDGGFDYFVIFGRVHGDKDDHQVTLTKEWAWNRIIEISLVSDCTIRKIPVKLPVAVLAIVLQYHSGDIDLRSTPLLPAP